ncbi:unnamed protein product [Owenia fusiformis]|uniref:UDENN domain-containing protein n=1 Tax=Owenia fusiformis TaxID=6347 RepID=A0A8S4NYR1_OWEFU|nr:unnamed protein product [Owenia fusiformis]
MGSRLRKNNKQIFELFCEVARPEDSDKDPFILQKFPDTYEEEDILKQIPSFTFPCKFESPAVDHFTFVLTDIDGKYKFGFCRHATGAQTCLCIVSNRPWYEIFYKYLNYVAEILNKTDDNSIEPILQALYTCDSAKPGDEVEVVAKNFTEKFSFLCPDLHTLPTIPENRNLTEYYNAIDANNMMTIFASMLYERRIIFTSKKLSRLTACVHGSASLLYPMHWQHLYIPVLPSHLIDYCYAPMPFIIGIHSSLMEKARNMELGDAIIVDADKNTVTSEHDDLNSMPDNVVATLKKHLRSQQSDRIKQGVMLSGDGVARAFLKCLAAIIGGYRDALKYRVGEKITFDRDAFIQTRPTSSQPFLEKILHLQLFEQFINDRLDGLMAGHGFRDEFENEANAYADKMSSHNKYLEWTNEMKKQGKRFRKDGKEKWMDFKGKANPALKHAANAVKTKSKQAYKDFKRTIDDLRKEEELHKQLGISKERPATIPSAELRGQRPPRPPPPGSRKADDVTDGGLPELRRHTTRKASYERAKQYKVISFDDSSVGDSDLEYRRISVGLVEDPDIQKAMKRSFSSDDLIEEETIETSSEPDDAFEDEVDTESDSSGPSMSDKVRNDHPIPAPRLKKLAQFQQGQSSKPSEQKDIAAPSSETLREDSEKPGPKPSPRHNITSDTPTKPNVNSDTAKRDIMLIRLDSLNVSEPGNIEFDPLAQNQTIGDSSSSNDLTGLESSQMVAQATKENDKSGHQAGKVSSFVKMVESGLDPTASGTPGKPVMRTDSFYRRERPQTVVHKPHDTKVAARTAFFEKPVSKPVRIDPSNFNSLDNLFGNNRTGSNAATSNRPISMIESTKTIRQFGGAISVHDTIKKIEEHKNFAPHEEDSLLKEWNLDSHFGKMRQEGSGSLDNLLKDLPTSSTSSGLSSPPIPKPLTKTTGSTPGLHHVPGPTMGLQQGVHSSPQHLMNTQPYHTPNRQSAMPSLMGAPQAFSSAYTTNRSSTLPSFGYQSNQSGFHSSQTNNPVSTPQVFQSNTLGSGVYSSQKTQPFSTTKEIPQSSNILQPMTASDVKEDLDPFSDLVSTVKSVVQPEQSKQSQWETFE